MTTNELTTYAFNYLAVGALFTCISLVIDAGYNRDPASVANRRNVLVLLFVWVFWLPIVILGGLLGYWNQMRP